MTESTIAHQFFQHCQRVLNTPTLDENLSFMQQSGNSLQLVTLISALMEEFSIPFPDFLLDEQLSLAQAGIELHHLVEQTTAPVNIQDSPELNALDNAPGATHIQPLKNRQRYLLLTKTGIERWFFTSPLLKFTGQPPSAETLNQAIRRFVNNHDSCRLTPIFTENADDYREAILPIDQNIQLVQQLHTPNGESQRSHLQHVIDQLQFSPGEPLIKALLIDECWLVLIINHLAMDAISFGFFIRTLFADLARQRRHIEQPHTIAQSGTSITTLQQHPELLAHKAYNYPSLPPELQRRCKGNYPEDNLAQYSQQVSRTLPLSQGNQAPDAETVLCAICLAWLEFTKNERKEDKNTLTIDWVFHNREPAGYLTLMDMTGWLSETRPLTVLLTNDPDQLRQRCTQALREKQYRQSQSTASNADQSLPALSFNYVSSSEQAKDYSAIAEEVSDAFTVRVPPQAHRVYPVSGGAFIKNKQFYLAFDHSERIFDQESIVEFVDLCFNYLCNMTMTSKS